MSSKASRCAIFVMLFIDEYAVPPFQLPILLVNFRKASPHCYFVYVASEPPYAIIFAFNNMMVGRLRTN